MRVLTSNTTCTLALGDPTGGGDDYTQAAFDSEGQPIDAHMADYGDATSHDAGQYGYGEYDDAAAAEGYYYDDGTGTYGATDDTEVAYDEYGFPIEGVPVEGASASTALDTTAPMDYGGGLKRTEDDGRTPDQRRLEKIDADAERSLTMYKGKTLTALQKEEQTKWIRDAEARLANPYHRPVRMANKPKVWRRFVMAVARCSRSRPLYHWHRVTGMRSKLIGATMHSASLSAMVPLHWHSTSSAAHLPS